MFIISCVLLVMYSTLCHVRVHVAVLALHVVFLNEPINILFDVTNPQHTTTDGRFDDFRHQFLMRDRLPTLHDPDDSCLTFKVPILGNTHVRLLVLLLGLFELHLVNFDAIFGMVELGVDGESVRVVDFFALGMFRERSQLGAGQRLESSFDFGFG